MKINFRIQILITLFLVIAGFISSLWFNKNIYYNLAWAFTGLVFFVNPVYPQNVIQLEEEKAKTGIRIAAVLLIFIGLTNGFGV